jgi:Tfp pilus assembly protein FimT
MNLPSTSNLNTEFARESSDRSNLINDKTASPAARRSEDTEFASDPKGHEAIYQTASTSRFENGFTLIEILVIIGIIGILGTFGLIVSLDYYRSFAFRSERHIVVSMLQKARNQSMSNVNEQPHGVKFLADRYVIYQGASYNDRDPDFDEEILTTPTVSHSGMDEVVFGQLKGNAVVTGTDLTLNGHYKHATITVNPEGQIDVPFIW